MIPFSYLSGSSIPLGETWTVSAGLPYEWFSVAYGNGRFVSTGRDRIAMSSTDGINWTFSTIPMYPLSGNQSFSNLVSGNDKFVATTSSGVEKFAWSYDGITWNKVLNSFENAAGAWLSSTYGNSKFIILGSNGVGAVSSNGINWTQISLPQANSWRGVTYGNGIFVAVSSDGTNRVMTSVDGVTWTLRNAAANNYWNKVAFGNGVFVAVSGESAFNTSPQRIMISSDGINWSIVTSSNIRAWGNAIFADGLFVIMANPYGFDGVGYLMTSTDGLNWTSRNIPGYEYTWRGITYGQGKFLAVSNTGTNRVMTAI